MSQPAPSPELLFGRHPVLEALRSGRPCQRLVLARGCHGEIIDEIFTLARQARIPFDLEDRVFLDRIAGPHHQGVVAFLAARAYAEFGPLLAGLDLGRAFLVFLDGIQDPHNLGAIIRSAHAVGADGVVVQERGAAGLGGTAAKASAGAIEHLPVCRVPNLHRALFEAKDAGVWIAGLDPDGGQSFTELDLCGPCGLVIGSEGRGLRRLVRQACDFLVRIPMGRGEVGSLNASVAAGLVLYEVFRQRGQGT
jgi:23S rRNA (guanosine2251-2'-O)-methyltransferase